MNIVESTVGHNDHFVSGLQLRRHLLHNRIRRLPLFGQNSLRAQITHHPGNIKPYRGIQLFRGKQANTVPPGRPYQSTGRALSGKRFAGMWPSEARR